LFAVSVGAVAAALASPATAALYDEDDPLGSGHGATGVGELDEQLGAGVLRAWAEAHCDLCHDAKLTPNSVVSSIVSSSRSTLYAALDRTKDVAAGSAVPHIGVAHCPGEETMEAVVDRMAGARSRCGRESMIAQFIDYTYARTFIINMVKDHITLSVVDFKTYFERAQSDTERELRFCQLPQMQRTSWQRIFDRIHIDYQCQSTTILLSAKNNVRVCAHIRVHTPAQAEAARLLPPRAAPPTYRRADAPGGQRAGLPADRPGRVLHEEPRADREVLGAGIIGSAPRLGVDKYAQIPGPSNRDQKMGK
jgi:hypothetical protein